MLTSPEPFLVLEPEAAPRLEALPVPLPPVQPRSFLRAPAAIGVAIVALAAPTLWVVSLAVDLFDHDSALGSAAAVVLVLAFGLIGLGMWRELRGLTELRRVDRLRLELASGEADRVGNAARRWLNALPAQASMLPALAAAETPEAVLALLRAGPGQALRDGTDVLGRTAALQSIAIVAATPSPALDFLTIGWCGLRLIRQVAVLHGMRPGLIGTIALLQKTALAAASVAVTEAAVNAATHTVIAHPLLRHLAGDIAGAGVAARRLIVLARAAAVACSPLPRL